MIVVRRIKTNDFASVVQVLNKAFKREISVVGLDLSRLLGFQKYHRVIEILYFVFDIFRKDYPTLLVASLGNKVVGEVHLIPLKKGIWTIDSLAVDPDYSQQGVGHNLIKESTQYIIKRQGEKAFSSIRTDNTPALKIAEKLGYLPYQKTHLFLCEIEDVPSSRITPDILIRKFQPGDATEVFRICRFTDPTKTKAYNMSPEDFFTTPYERILNRMLQQHCSKLVVEIKGRIQGYVHFTYTSQSEAARIEHLCLPSNPELTQLTEILLDYILGFLAKKHIRKVLLSLNQKRDKTIEAIKQKGFQPLASFQEIAKKLN